jgi:signal transduction histidine kinase
MTDTPPVDRANERPGPLELDASRAALALFARRVSHDLNNYATIIQTYTELALADVQSAAVRADLGEVRDASAAMVEYLRRITRFSRVTSMKRAPVEAGAVVRDAVALLAAHGAPITAALELHGTTDARVLTDALWLTDVLKELVTNACEASPEGCAVVIELQDVRDDAGGWLLLRVSDRGNGFADAVAHNAEAPFVTTKDGVRGAGFGLALASAYATQLEGRLRRFRRADQTCVELWMPVCVDD